MLAYNSPTSAKFAFGWLYTDFALSDPDAVQHILRPSRSGIGSTESKTNCPAWSHPFLGKDWRLCREGLGSPHAHMALYSTPPQYPRVDTS
jgi:hypothetical protein